MFFLKLLESKKWWKLTSFGVDMFFSNSCKSKNGENGPVLVLTCFFSNFWCWHVFLKLVQVKKWGKFISFGVNMFFSQTFGVDMFFSNSWSIFQFFWLARDWNLEPWGKLPKVLSVETCFSQTSGIQNYVENWLAIWCWHVSFSTPENPKNGENWLVLSVDMFFSNSWNPKNGQNWLVFDLHEFEKNMSTPKLVNGVHHFLDSRSLRIQKHVNTKTS